MRGAIYSIHRNSIVCFVRELLIKTTSSARHILSIDFDICFILIEHSIFCFDVWVLCARARVCVRVSERARPVFALANELIFDFDFFILSEDLFFHFKPGLCFYFCIDGPPPSVVRFFDLILYTDCPEIWAYGLHRSLLLNTETKRFPWENSLTYFFLLAMLLNI